MVNFRDKSNSYFDLFSIAKWILGKHHSKVLILASLAQAILALLDILFLALIGPLTISLSTKATFDNNFSVLGLFSISGSEILFLIVLVIIVKNISGLTVQRLVLNSFAFREAEVGTALVQASLYSKNESDQALHSSNLLQTITNTVNMLFGNLFRPIIGFIAELATVMAISVGLLIVNTEVAIISFCYFSCLGFFMIRFIGRKQQIIGENALKAGRDSLRSFTEIQLMSRELQFANRDQDALIVFNQHRNKAAKLSADSAFVHIFAKSFIEVVFLFGIGLIVIYLQFFQKNESTLSILALLAAAGYRILPSLGALTLGIGNIRHSFALLESIDSLGRRFNIRSSSLLFVKTKGLQGEKQFSGDLKLENVFYQYPISKKVIFNDFNLLVKSGETLLIQGLSGTGKTTLISLVTGSLAPQQGRIYAIDGNREIIMDGTVNGISYLSQEVPLFDESFGYNVAMEEPLEKDFPRLKDAADKAGILDRILQSPAGFKTQIGENGALLSAGERQRLGIARSLYAQPKLLILDEPTANLDAVSEELVWNTMIKIKGELTILIVSHRQVPEQVYDNVLKLPRSS
jgi:ABC-type multidrug transport system fused ATPase/permease subunit